MFSLEKWSFGRVRSGAGVGDAINTRLSVRRKRLVPTEGRMSKPFKIGAKALAAMVMPCFCRRCMWYLLHCGTPPFSIFASIFTELDLFQKSIIHANIDHDGRAPKWLGSFSQAVAYEEVGFLKWTDEENSIMLKGAPDIVLRASDESRLFLGDLKTARYHSGKDHLLPLYKIQLLAYSFLLVKNGYPKPERAALFYFGPPAKPTEKELLAATRKYGFDLAMSVEVVDIDLGEFKVIEDLLAQARYIYDLEKAPKGCEGCRDCTKLDAFMLQSQHDDGGIRDYQLVDYMDGNGRWRRTKVIPMASDYADPDYDVADDWVPVWAQSPDGEP